MSLSTWIPAALARTPSAVPEQAIAAEANIAQVAPLGTLDDPSAPPFDGVVAIYDQIGGQSWQGSGVLISPDEVLTASHVLYHAGFAPATDVQVIVGQDGPTIGREVDGTAAHYFPIDDSGGKITLATTQMDYAIVHLDHPVTGNTIFNPLSNFGGGIATVAGYPGNAGYAQLSTTSYFSVDPTYTVLDGAALGPGSSGGPVFVTGGDGQAYVAGIVSSENTDNTAYGYDAQITGTVLNQIESWVAQDDGTRPGLAALDTTSNEGFDPQGTAYSGPVAGLAEQYINVTADNLNVTAGSSNWFIHSGAGEDALNAHGGINVLDGGTGSNFLVGGTGAGSRDTFYTDDRGATASIWDTVVNFHSGDAATLFGVTQAGFTFDWEDGQGAAGSTGLTLHATAAGHPEASITLAGYSRADLASGRLTVSFGTTQGIPYLYIHGT